MINIANQNYFRNKSFGPNSNRNIVPSGQYYGPSQDISQCETFGRLDDITKLDNLKRIGDCFYAWNLHIWAKTVVKGYFVMLKLMPLIQNASLVFGSQHLWRKYNQENILWFSG